jgi:anti-sigma regulatory factor (Ser/Thr protein kinase)
VTDEITLVVPAQEDVRPVVHLVVGGLAAQLDLTMDTLSDLQVALDATLAYRDSGEDVTVRVAFDDAALHTTVGPLSTDAAQASEDVEPELGLGRVLEAVCDAFECDERDGEIWIQMTRERDTPTHAGG